MKLFTLWSVGGGVYFIVKLFVILLIIRQITAKA